MQLLIPSIYMKRMEEDFELEPETYNKCGIPNERFFPAENLWVSVARLSRKPDYCVLSVYQDKATMKYPNPEDGLQVIKALVDYLVGAEEDD